MGQGVAQANAVANSLCRERSVTMTQGIDTRPYLQSAAEAIPLLNQGGTAGIGNKRPSRP
ncbi:MAG: hypothetical protein OHK0046_03520 [Anaerolineae bacterium]